VNAYLQTSILVTHGQLPRERVVIRPLSIRASAQFTAAPMRLSYALTLPEYVETWLTAPETDDVRCMGDPAAGQPLSIELRRNRRITTRIFADYISVQPYDLQIRWHICSRTSTYLSHVRIAIRTVRTDTALRVCHTGFTNPHDWRWHQELWGLSLEKMKILLR
jgi:hypothetical protein